MRTPGRRSRFKTLVVGGTVVLAVGCKFASPESRGTAGGGGLGGGASGGGGAGGRMTPNIGGFPGKDAGTDAPVFPTLTDFPVDPIIDPSAPADAPALFDGATPRAGGAPCFTSPIAGTLMPRNWLRPRFDLAPAAGENLFEIKLTVAGFAHPLRIFTRNPSTALTADIWNRLRTSIVDQTITVTARALQTDANGAVQLGPSAPAESSFAIAPVEAPGKIVYWALADDMGTKVGSLKGFGIGEEGVRDVLVPSQVASRAPSETCVGCHTATPDGNGVGFSMGPTNYFGNIADIRTGSTGALPSYVDQNAMSMIRTLRGIPAYSKGHWSDGDRVVLLSDTGTSLHWVQIDGTARGVLARTGDAGKVTEPTWSHDGNQVVYVSATSITDGRLSDGPADLYWIPYADRAGGNAAPLPGASDPAATEFYPAFSPDDRLVAFTRLAGSGSSYSNPASEVFVVPFAGGAGGTPVRLAANDAAACQTTLASPGLTNDWPKWSPRTVTANGKTYYWLTFSSKRMGTANAQLYVTALVVDGAGKVSTYPALYLWNQPAADGNHTPSWDDFVIPPIIVD
jgi:hypothetical protein